jgi:hypothetical protein
MEREYLGPNNHNGGLAYWVPEVRRVLTVFS